MDLAVIPLFVGFAPLFLSSVHCLSLHGEKKEPLDEDLTLTRHIYLACRACMNHLKDLNPSKGQTICTYPNCARGRLEERVRALRAMHYIEKQPLNI
ncbi:MAG: hypothetical protein ACE5HG_03750 [Candidatus Bathyarchaeia archaeon]